jgi:hypothetical protein
VDKRGESKDVITISSFYANSDAHCVRTGGCCGYSCLAGRACSGTARQASRNCKTN